MDVTLSALRDFNVRLENGRVVEMWCVLPEDQHHAAMGEMAVIGHRIELSHLESTQQIDQIVNPYTSVSGFSNGVIYVETHSDDGDLEDTLPFGFSTDWAWHCDGRMVIVNRAD